MTDVAAYIPFDRYCFAPCPEQLVTGTCDCTRRIDREVAAKIAAAEKPLSYPEPHDEFDAFGPVFPC